MLERLSVGRRLFHPIRGSCSARSCSCLSLVSYLIVSRLRLLHQRALCVLGSRSVRTGQLPKLPFDAAPCEGRNYPVCIELRHVRLADLSRISARHLGSTKGGRLPRAQTVLLPACHVFCYSLSVPVFLVSPHPALAGVLANSMPDSRVLLKSCCGVDVMNYRTT